MVVGSLKQAAPTLFTRDVPDLAWLGRDDAHGSAHWEAAERVPVLEIAVGYVVDHDFHPPQVYPGLPTTTEF